jgi:hypothetical protein
MNTTSSDLSKWKNGAAKSCYEKLFEQIDPYSEEDNKITYMSKILEKVWTNSDKASNSSVAFAIGVCEELLNPDNESIQITGDVLKYKLKKNLVRFAILLNVLNT